LFQAEAKVAAAIARVWVAGEIAFGSVLLSVVAFWLLWVVVGVMESFLQAVKKSRETRNNPIKFLKFVINF